MFYPYEGYRSVTPLDAARVFYTLSMVAQPRWHSHHFDRDRNVKNSEVVKIQQQQAAANNPRVLFERSEFLIDTSQKKSLRVCPCARVK